MTIPAFVNDAPQVSGLQIALLNTLEQIDCALDRGDRKAFCLWSKRLVSLRSRLETLLVKIATASE